MVINAIVDKIISEERLQPYLNHHSGNYDKAIAHYKANVLISESFYPLLSVLEVGLRNSVEKQFVRQFLDNKWYENVEFIKLVSKYQIDRISDARKIFYLQKRKLRMDVLFLN